MLQTAVYVLTPTGLAPARQLARQLPAELFAARGLAEYLKQDEARLFERLLPLVEQTFARYRAHVFVCATGIAVRAIAPHLADKAADPAVVSLDDQGRFAVSLVSGHLGGANALVRQVAEVTGAQAVVSTATDLAGVPAVDLLAKELGLTMADVSRVKHVSSALLAGKEVARHDPGGLLDGYAEWLPARALEHAGDGPVVWVDYKVPPARDRLLALHPPVLWAGVGCRRGTPAMEILKLLHGALGEAGLARQSLAGLASVEDKADEPGLLEAAAVLKIPLTCYARTQLREMDVPNPSQRVMQAVGTPSVCEAAARKAAGEDGRLLIEKTKSDVATVAVALGVHRRTPWA